MEFIGSKTASTDVSLHMSEEQIIDTVFQTCDESSSGLVQVSRLVDCVRIAAAATGSQRSTGQVRNDRLKLLVELLDPSGTNPKVSLSTYRSGIGRWIQMLRLNEFPDEECEEPEAAGNCKGVATKSVLLSSDRFPPVSSGVELYDRIDEFDTLELRNRLQCTEQQNRRYAEEVSDLWKQLNASDDAVSHLKQEIAQLKQMLKCNQATIDRLSAVRTENEELKLTLDSCMEEKKQLQTDFAKSDLANKHLTEKTSDLQEQLSSARSDIESAEEELLNIQQQLNDKMLKMLSVEKTMEDYQLQLVDKTNTVEEMEKKITALSEVNKELLKHNSEIEAQLAENKQLLHLQTVELTKRQLLCDCFHEEVEDDIELMPFTPRLPSRQSTPHRRNVVSLQQELTSKIGKEPVLPSPLCDKELEGLFCGSGKVESKIVKDTNDSCITKLYDDTSANADLSLSNTFPTSAFPKLCTESNSNHPLNVTQLEDSLTKEVECIAEMAIARNTQQYRCALAGLVERMMSCTDARIAAEQRNVALSTTLRELQERMEDDDIQHRLALQDLENRLKNSAEELRAYEIVEDDGSPHRLALQELENRLKITTEQFQSQLKEKDCMIEMEKGKNKDLELRIIFLEWFRLNENNTCVGGEEQIRVSEVTDGRQMALVRHPGVERNVLKTSVDSAFTNRLRDNAEKSEATVKLLMQLFQEYERRGKSLLMVRCQTAGDSHRTEAAYGEQSRSLPSVGRRQQNDGYQLTTAAANDGPVASCCHVVISLLISVLAVLLFGIIHVKNQLRCGRTLWAAFEEIFRPHITLHHSREPPL